MFLSAKCSVDTWAHSATQSLHRVDWSIDGKPTADADIVDVVRSISMFFKLLSALLRLVNNHSFVY